MEAFFSIVVVCLNPGDKLKETVSSILNQTCENYEIIIKDGGSTDGSLLDVPVDKRIRIFEGKDLGIYDAMNHAIRYIRGEYVLFLNCGDYFYNNEVLSGVEKFIKEDQGRKARAIYYGNIFERKTGNIVQSNPKINDFACYRNLPCHQCCFYARSLLKARPLAYMTRYKVRADYEHFLFCYFKGRARTQYIDIVVSSYEGNGFSETPEGLKISAEEHKEITRNYMGFFKRFAYKAAMICTLAPVRTKIAGSKKFSGTYQKLKKKLYR